MNSVPAEILPVKQMSISGADLAFVEEGAGETAVFVHGANGDWRTWDSLRPYLREHLHYVALSRRYHRPNPWPGDGKDYTLDRHVQDLAAFVKALGVGPVHLVGGSYGGRIAVHVALAHPDLVSSLILSEPGLVHSETPEALAAIAEWTQTLMPPVRQAIQEGDARKASVLLWNAVNDERFHFERTPVAVRERWLANADTLPLLFDSPASPALTCDDLGALRAPTLVVGSEYIRPYFRQSNDRLAQCLPVGTSTSIVPHAPHVWYPVSPKAGADAILGFLSALWAGARRVPGAY